MSAHREYRRNLYFSSTLIIVGAFFINTATAIQWLALSKVSTIAAVGTGSSICDQFTDTLVNKQVQFCKKHPVFMQSVQSGASRAIDECKFQFRSRRWNCSTLDDYLMLPMIVSFPKLQPAKRKIVNREINPNTSQIEDNYKIEKKQHYFGSRPIVPGGTREAAFVHAISAAGVAHALTRACSAGELEDCGCDRTIRGLSSDGFQWAGCSDNVLFGTSFSRTFVDAREHKFTKRKGKNSTQTNNLWRALMNLHNNEAGRKIIEKSMRTDCKCHGVSGSCELKTCWKAMPSFREVGEILKDKFDSATEVEPRMSHSGSRRSLIPRSPTYKPHTDTDLVYLDRSPDYCEFDSKIGSLGTHNRFCNKTSKGIDGCELLCCNRGFKSHRERIAERCMCKFHWCCSVQCKTCLREVEIYTCI